jgi:hypothetical protein
MDPAVWHAEEQQRYALTLHDVIDESPLLSEAAAACEPSKLLRCPHGHPLFTVTPAHDAHGRVVLTIRGWVDPRILQPSYPGTRERTRSEGTPNELEPKITLTCAARGCRFRRSIQRSDLLRHYATHLYRSGDITIPG